MINGTAVNSPLPNVGSSPRSEHPSEDGRASARYLDYIRTKIDPAMKAIFR